MDHASIFTGIGGFDLGFELAGMTTVLQVENDDKCLKILERWWKNVRKINNIKNVVADDVDGVHVISGGFPCQDLSTAGKRAGLSGDKSGLWYSFHRIIEESHPPIVVIENVPGLLSSNNGRDFGIIIGSLVELGYSVAWRILNTRFFGIPQNRRRIFIIGSYRTDSAGKIFFDGESVTGNNKTGRKKRKKYPGTYESDPFDNSGTIAPYYDRATGGMPGSEFKKFTCAKAVTSKYAKQSGGPSGDECGNLTFPVLPAWGTSRTGGYDPGYKPLNPTPYPYRVRETPGVPAGLDTPRFKQIGNAVSVPIAFWIGKRIIKYSGVD